MKESKSMAKSLEEYSKRKGGGKEKKCPKCGNGMAKGKCKNC
jgi:hypothetical protein